MTTKHTRSLREALLARVTTPVAVDDPDCRVSPRFALTRRQFLGSAGTVGIVAAALDLAPEIPRVVRRGGELSVSYRGHQWRLALADFGSAARLVSRRTTSGFEIELLEACLPGTNVAFDLVMRLFEERGDWVVAAVVDALRFRASAPLHAWLARSAALAGTGSVGAFTVGGQQIVCPGSCRLSFAAPFRLEMAGADGAPIRLPDCPVTSVQHIELATGEALETSYSEILRRWPASPVTVLRSVGNVHNGALLSICPTPGSCHADYLPSGSASLLLEATFAGGGSRGVMLLESEGTLHAGSRQICAHSGGAVRFEHAAFVTSTTEQSNAVGLAGRVSRLPHFIDVGGAQVLIAGMDEEPFYLEMREGAVAQSRTTVRLREIRF
jgi:hypothetical protein